MIGAGSILSRIIDVDKFLTQYPFAAADRVSEVLLTIDDTQAPWNAGDYRLRIEPDGTASVSKTDTSSTASQGRPMGLTALSCDIATLTSMLLGGRRPQWLHRVGRVTGPEDQVAVLERRMPALRPYLADFF